MTSYAARTKPTPAARLRVGCSLTARRSLATNLRTSSSPLSARAGIDRATALLDPLGSENPLFLYLHYMDPHPPFTPDPEEAERFETLQDQLPPEYPPEREKLRANMARYDAEILGFDVQFARLRIELEERGLWEDAFVIVTADHGYPFDEHGVKWHERKVHNVDTHVPLLVPYGGRNETVDATVSTIDIMPTILSELGLDRDASMQGVPLFDEPDVSAARSRRTRSASSTFGRTPMIRPTG